MSEQTPFRTGAPARRDTGKPMPGSRAGFVALAGAPNVGKSTLINQILGEKLSIISDKPQTTRNRILGVINREGSQIVLLDTPGVHEARGALNRHIVQVALSTLKEVDVVVFVADVKSPDTRAENMVINALSEHKGPVVLAANKIDLVKKPDLLPVLERWQSAFPFAAYVPVSALYGTQVQELLAAVEELLPEGPPLYPEETFTDMPERFFCAELIREKVFHVTSQEVPYSTAVTIDAFEEESAGPLVRIAATIHVERNSQKGIIIGKKGAMLKKIGTAARKDMERMLGVRVFLELFVRMEKNWSTDTRRLKKLGYE